MYLARSYRRLFEDKFNYTVTYKAADIYFCSSRPLEKDKLKERLFAYYTQIEEYIAAHPLFLSSLSPLDFDDNAPAIIKTMLSAGKKAGIGPFSAVAGAVALYIGKELFKPKEELVIENGGDVFLATANPKRVLLQLGRASKIKQVEIVIPPRKENFGMGSSSAKIGHSLNFGSADLVTVIAKNSAYADSFATAFSNQIKNKKDLEEISAFARREEDIYGFVAVLGNSVACWGDIEIKNIK